MPPTSVIVDPFAIEFVLDDAVTLGALQFIVDYASAPGDFLGTGADLGSGGTLQCSSPLVGTFASFNDCDLPGGCPPLAERQLSAGFISLGGFSGPASLATCAYAGPGGAPASGDLLIEVTDAASPALVPILPLPSVRALLPQ
jgi:hypothetical protein